MLVCVCRCMCMCVCVCVLVCVRERERDNARVCAHVCLLVCVRHDKYLCASGGTSEGLAKRSDFNLSPSLARVLKSKATGSILFRTLNSARTSINTYIHTCADTHTHAYKYYIHTYMICCKKQHLLAAYSFAHIELCAFTSGP